MFNDDQIPVLHRRLLKKKKKKPYKSQQQFIPQNHQLSTIIISLF